MSRSRGWQGIVPAKEEVVFIAFMVTKEMSGLESRPIAQWETA